MKNLSWNNAILTGASKGLGVHIARALAKEGVNLVLIARSADALEKVRDEMMTYDVKAVVIPADLTETGNFDSLIAEAEKKLGPIDILVNNAGIEISTPYEKFSPDDIQKMITLNLTVPMLLTRAVMPGMLKRNRGHFVNISSLAGKTGFPTQTPYAASKAGLIMFTHSLRIELGDTQIGASVVCPGFVSDDGMYARMEERAGPAPKILKPTTPEKVAKGVVRCIKKNIPELIINPLPMKPLFMLQEAIPGIKTTLHKAFGTPEFAEKITLEKSETEK
ncbi:SDR family oxidoreductase [Rhodohalobacter sp. SW132]|uniref:SDR family NAD(P)-dependent oxidoreductase n=1 Tax=Rhodohalobacter sp. SW132 TaxID=2293433 RepID=UPI000E225DC0|nr:SDR family oxidoreductase [Rhodohalobacter sp. SW132]REL39198.1 SDR family oxidoreductase [Rhodohalobacter sp. SW132]